MIRIASVALACAVMLMGCGEAVPVEEQQNEQEIVPSSVQASDTVAEQGPEPRFGVDRRRVRIGFDGPEFDACGGYGEITAVDPDAERRLSVRNAPDINADEVDQISAGTGISICEEVRGWIGIVYAGDGEQGGDCGTGSPVADIRDYSGPCRSGWVSNRNVNLIAG